MPSPAYRGRNIDHEGNRIPLGKIPEDFIDVILRSFLCQHMMINMGKKKEETNG